MLEFDRFLYKYDVSIFQLILYSKHHTIFNIKFLNKVLISLSYYSSKYNNFLDAYI